MSDKDDFAGWWEQMLAKSATEDEAVHQAFQELENAGLINRVVCHRYLCGKCGKVLATVIRVGDRVLCRTQDYKVSDGLNQTISVEAARQKNTLDGRRWWPGHTFDVGAFASHGDAAGFDMGCRHVRHTELASAVLAKIDNVVPGHPGKPTRLFASPLT